MQMDMREPGLWGTWITTEERDMLERWRKEHPEGNNSVQRSYSEPKSKRVTAATSLTHSMCSLGS